MSGAIESDNNSFHKSAVINFLKELYVVFKEEKNLEKGNDDEMACDALPAPKIVNTKEFLQTPEENTEKDSKNEFFSFLQPKKKLRSMLRNKNLLTPNPAQSEYC